MTEILLTRDGPVTTLTINRPEVRNAIGPSLIAQLTQMFSALAMDDSRVMVLTGAGSAFSAGADIDWMRASRDLAPRAERRRRGRRPHHVRDDRLLPQAA